MNASSTVQPARGGGARSGNRIRDRDQGEQQGDETASHPRHVAHALLIGLFAHIEFSWVAGHKARFTRGYQACPGRQMQKLCGPTLTRNIQVEHSVLCGNCWHRYPLRVVGVDSCHPARRTAKKSEAFRSGRLRSASRQCLPLIKSKSSHSANLAGLWPVTNLLRSQPGRISTSG